jgi:hypothetical protein
MKVKRGDRVALLNLKNMHGVDFQLLLGELTGVRKHWGSNIYKIEAKKLVLLQGDTDMKGKEMEVSADAFTLMKITPEVTEKLKELRALAQNMQKAQMQLRNIT